MNEPEPSTDHTRMALTRPPDLSATTTSTLEDEVFDVLRPGGMLTADTIAHNLNAPKWRVVRVLNTLRDKGNAFRNRRGEWQLSAGKRRPERQVIR
ncbi:hypothetical protein [Nocardia coubleae]|uniref:Uncharacterized protein n=1 Tax=Nocardia coubleae TaxID=356147 RepID=A0A846VZZ0_9NOCA|nr:hypothetical protein [Nocardia coubleae]NKX86411.1 hypothetical protein [Nocardia coubleae]